MLKAFDPQEIVDRAIVSTADLAGVEIDLEAIRSLLTRGLEATASRMGTSERTIRRAFAASGTRASDFLISVRREATRDLLSAGISSDDMAALLGFSSDQTLHRFLRREFASRVRDLRREAVGLPQRPSVIRLSEKATSVRVHHLDSTADRDQIASTRRSTSTPPRSDE